MTRAQRAQVVELLRCAADLRWTCITTSMLLGSSDRVYDIATDALDAVWSRHGDYVTMCLEAAARVEQGEWP